MSVTKILVNLPNWLGDTVMATPAIYLLKDTFCNADLVLVGNALSIGVFKKDDFISDLILDDTRSGGLLWRLVATRHLASRINMCHVHFDIVLTFQNNFFSALLLRLINARCRIGYGDKNLFGLRKFLLNHRVSFKSGRNPFCNHQVLSYVNLLINVVPEDVLERVQVSKKHYGDSTSARQRRLFSLVSDMRLQVNSVGRSKGNKIMAVAPNASFGPSKEWVAEYFCEVIANLLTRGFRVRIYGSKVDVVYNRRITHGVSRLLSKIDSSSLFHNLEDCTGATTLDMLLESMNECDFFLGNDSGLSHVARALGLSMVVIFGSTPLMWGSPWSNKELVISKGSCVVLRADNAICLYKDLPCQPCLRRRCPLSHYNCVRLITPEDVLSSIEHLVSIR